MHKVMLPLQNWLCILNHALAILPLDRLQYFDQELLTSVAERWLRKNLQESRVFLEAPVVYKRASKALKCLLHEALTLQLLFQSSSQLKKAQF